MAEPSPEQPVPCGRYELLERIGYGGMAEVFRARLTGPSGFSKKVVIKRILPRMADDHRVVRMFLEEAKIAAEADHDNIAKVFELGVGDDGRFFMAMEYIPGIDLEALLGSAAKRSLRVPPWFAIHAVCEVLEALTYVHELRDDAGRPRNVVHRDATPSNIFISRLGQVKLTDFGIAHYEGKSPTTQAGQLKGKVAYMSPEQLNGHRLDHRVDIFAVGVVLWEVLTHRRLFGAMSEVQAMMAICEAERPRPSELVPDLPSDLDACTVRALAIHPDDRYASAAELQTDLLDVLHRMRAPIRRGEIRDTVAMLTGRLPPNDETQTGTLPAGPTDASFIQRLRSRPNKSETSAPPAAPRKGSNPLALAADLLDDIPTAAKDPLPEAVETWRDRSQPSEAITFDGPFDAATAHPVYGDPFDRTVRDEEMGGIAKAPPNVEVGPVPEDPQDEATRFWVKRVAETPRGPYDLLQATEQLSIWAKDGIPTAISHDERHWVDSPIYADLAGVDLGTPTENDGAATMAGSSAERGLPAVLAVLARDRATGHLTVTCEASEPSRWFELRLHGGRPTRVRTNVAAMHLPYLLVSEGLATAPGLASLVSRVLTEERPLHEILADEGYPALSPFEIAQLRVTELFRWPRATYEFVAARNDPAEPALADSVLALLPVMVRRSLDTPTIAAKLRPFLATVHETSWRYDDALAELGLTADEREAAECLRHAAPLAELIHGRPEARPSIMRMALLLIEADLLLPS